MVLLAILLSFFVLCYCQNGHAQLGKPKSSEAASGRGRGLPPGMTKEQYKELIEKFHNDLARARLKAKGIETSTEEPKTNSNEKESTKEKLDNEVARARLKAKGIDTSTEETERNSDENKSETNSNEVKNNTTTTSENQETTRTPDSETTVLSDTEETTSPEPTSKRPKHHSQFLSFIGLSKAPPPLPEDRKIPKESQNTPKLPPKNEKQDEFDNFAIVTPALRSFVPIVPIAPLPATKAAREELAIKQLLTIVNSPQIRATQSQPFQLPGFKRASVLLPQYVSGIKFFESESLRQAMRSNEHLPGDWLVPYYSRNKY